jgi:TetR/AcrR family tetracycline transcriptional repressor
LLHFILGHVSHEQQRLQYDSLGVVSVEASDVATGDREAFAFGVTLLIEGLRHLHSSVSASGSASDVGSRPASH